jgi:hypothetical protein
MLTSPVGHVGKREWVALNFGQASSSKNAQRGSHSTENSFEFCAG